MQVTKEREKEISDDEAEEEEKEDKKDGEEDEDKEKVRTPTDVQFSCNCLLCVSCMHNSQASLYTTRVDMQGDKVSKQGHVIYY